MKARIPKQPQGNHNDTDGEYNPYLKATLLEVVDNQLRDNDPPETRETLERLMASGHTEQSAKERIASVVLMHVYDAMHDLKDFDGEKYKKDLAELK